MTGAANADLTRVTVLVDATGLRGRLVPARTKVADEVASAIGVDAAFLRRNRVASACIAGLTGGTVGVLGTTTRILTFVINAGRGIRTLIIAGAERAEDATVGDAIETRAAVTVALAGDWLTELHIAALVRTTVRIADTVPAGETHIIAALGARWAIRIGLATGHFGARITDAGLTARAVGVVGAARLVDARTAEQVANLASGAFGISTTLRRDLAVARDTLSPGRTIRVDVTLRAGRDAGAAVTYLIGPAIRVGGALRLDRLADAIRVALEALRTIGVDHALSVRHTLAVVADLVIRAVGVGLTSTRGNTLLIAANLARVTFGVGVTLADKLTLEIQATFTGATLGIRLATRVRDTEAEFADLTARTVAVGLTLSRRDRHAASADA